MLQVEEVALGRAATPTRMLQMEDLARSLESPRSPATMEGGTGITGKATPPLQDGGIAARSRTPISVMLTLRSRCSGQRRLRQFGLTAAVAGSTALMTAAIPQLGATILAAEQIWLAA